MSAVKLFQPIRGDLFSHQRTGIREGLKFNGFGLFFEPRLGKTRTAIGILGHRWKLGQVEKCLVVAPKDVYTVWEDQLLDYANFPFRIFDASDGKRISRKPILEEFVNASPEGKSVSILFLNYESSWRWIDSLISSGLDMIIADEGHKIKGPKSKQSGALHNLGDRVTYKLDLTGTPAPESPLDLWSQYRFLNPSIFGKSYEDFEDRYAIRRPRFIYLRGRRKQIFIISGTRRKQEISQRMHQIAIRRTMDECLDMPPILEVFRRVRLSEEALNLEKRVYKDYSIFIGNQQLERKTLSDAAMKSQQIAGGFLKHKDSLLKVGSEKADMVLELLDEMERREQVVIFTNYSHEIEMLVKRINVEGHRSAEPVEGGRDNRTTIREFQRGRINVIICQSGVGNLGQDFSNSRVMIFYSVSNKFQDFYQAKMRLLGPKQKRKVSYIYLKADETADEDYYEALRRKQSVEAYLCEKYRIR